jgi:phosphatidylinositol alpha-1,6-mannosyltransferase
MHQIAAPHSDMLKGGTNIRSISPFPNVQMFDFDQKRPILCVVVDAEEEFRWERPVSPSANRTASIRSQRRAHAVFSHYGVRPTYLVTYPVATDPIARGILGDYLAAGQCDIGAQLHPWVTPPHFPSADEGSTFPGNLPEAVEKAKIEELTAAIQTAFGIQPTVYKAGRYGFGPRTARLIEEAGYLVDTSLIPRTSYAAVGGPDLSRFDYKPFWFGERRRLLELPVTRALIGLMATLAPSIYRAADSKPMRALHAGGLLSRSGLMERVTLSPEGSDLEAMCRLTQALLTRGERIFTLSYHSPSLEPGNTPYVSNARDLAIFLDRLSGFLHFFQNTLGGEFLTVQEVRGRLLGVEPVSEPDGVPASKGIRTPAQAGKRCLVVANTFPPIVGGSAVVYNSLSRFGRGRVSVLAPSDDYRTGWPIGLWRETDAIGPFPVHRIPRLRTELLPDEAGITQRLGTLASDLAIRVSVMQAIIAIVRSEEISVICIGELVACGWLTRICRDLLRLKVIIYVHGEEITTRSPYDMDGRRRRRALAAADGCVAVSRFTRDTLIESFGVQPARIELISNGVDLGRFRKRPRRPDLIARHGLVGKRVLLTVGRLYARKGVDRVIESLPRVFETVGDLHYVVVGDGPYLPVLEELARRLGIADRVIFAGAVSDDELVDYYAFADAFIMANREMPDGDTEGFGLVFLEANACGLPVIAGRAGGSVDAVTHELNGLVIDGDDSGAIARAIERVFLDDEHRLRLIAGGIEVANRSGWDQKVEQFLGFCDRLMLAGV